MHQNLHHTIVRYMEAPYISWVDIVRRRPHRSRKRSRESGREGSHGELVWDVVNGLCALERSRKRRNRNQRNLAYACRYPSR